jgi:hypothetical protein
MKGKGNTHLSSRIINDSSLGVITDMRNCDSYGTRDDEED